MNELDGQGICITIMPAPSTTLSSSRYQLSDAIKRLPLPPASYAIGFRCRRALEAAGINGHTLKHFTAKGFIPARA